MTPQAARAVLPAHLESPVRRLAEESLAQVLRDLGVPGPELERRSLAPALEALAALLDGYGRTAGEVVGDALFDEGAREPVMVRDIPFVAVCEDHLMPFHGHAMVVYLPGDRVVGLSKLARLVDLFAHRLQSPSRLADEIARALEETLGARGVAVRIEARHLCPGTTGTTTAASYLGELRLPLWRQRLERLP